MFNVARPQQPRYTSPSNPGLGGSFVDENPLANSTYDDSLDPWSAAPTPPVAQPPPKPFNGVLGTAAIPAVYERAFAAVDPIAAGETSLNSLHKVLATSSLPASTIDRIVNLVSSSRSRVTKLEFFVALALVGCAQTSKDVSIEQVAQLAEQDALPDASLDLLSLASSVSTFAPRSPPISRNTYAESDPWTTPSVTNRFPGGSGANAGPSTNGTTAASILSGGLPKDWWKRLENVAVTVAGQQGFILNRYTVYNVHAPSRGPPVTRRYSEFTFLWDCLVRRYPFRILVNLPPKRIGSDENFLEQRRKGLVRFLNFVVNHPVLKEDGLVAVFLTEPSFESWRKHASISLDEESMSKRVDRIEEMSIPSDLEEKLAVVRRKLGLLIEHWTRVCVIAERILRRREAAAVRPPLSDTSLSYLMHLPFFSSPSARPSPSDIPVPRPSTLDAHPASFSDGASMISSLSALSPFTASGSPRLASVPIAQQADLSRLTLTLNVLTEGNAECWRGDACDLCAGVRHGLAQVSTHLGHHADHVEQRTRALLLGGLEALKSQRDLYIGMRDLFSRHDRLSVDQVDRLRKRIETNSLKLEGIKAAQKDGWATEADKVVGLIEKDQIAIGITLARRVFIRYCMWHELRVVLHNHENALLTIAIQTFAREETAFSGAVCQNWSAMVDAVENMPLE